MATSYISSPPSVPSSEPANDSANGDQGMNLAAPVSQAYTAGSGGGGLGQREQVVGGDMESCHTIYFLKISAIFSSIRENLQNFKLYRY